MGVFQYPIWNKKYFAGFPEKMDDLKSFYQGESLLFERNKDIIKSRNLSDRRKNEYEIENYNSALYKSILLNAHSNRIIVANINMLIILCLHILYTLHNRFLI